MVCNSGTCTLDIADWDTQLCTTTIKVEKSQKVSSLLSCVLILQTRKLSKFKKKIIFGVLVSNFPTWNMVSFASKPNQKKLRERGNIKIAWIWIRATTTRGKTDKTAVLPWFHETECWVGSGIMPVMCLPLCLSSLQKINLGDPIDECFVCL